MGQLITRRSFIKTMAAAGSLGALCSLAKPATALAMTSGATPDGYGVLTDITRCIGCRRCEAACNTANNLPAPERSFEDKGVFENKRRTDEVTLTVVNRYSVPETGQPVYVKSQCNHCLEPACASACLVGALKKSPDGPVTYNESICIGCRYCITACPFYIPAFEYFDAGTPAIKKCMMCNERLQQGEVPACVAECPVGALTFGKRADLLALAHERIRLSPDKYVDHVYGETEAGGTSWIYLAGVDFSALGFPANLGTEPMPKYTKDFLTAVPLVLTAWPALLGGIYLFSRDREEDKESAEEKTASEGAEK